MRTSEKRGKSAVDLRGMKPSKQPRTLGDPFDFAKFDEEDDE